MKSTLFLCIGCAALAVFVAACRRSDDAQQSPPPLVTVSLPSVEPVTEYLDLTGTAAASQSVDLVARIPGYLQSIRFKDGSFVDANQLLFVIEPEPYQQNVKIAQAQLLQAQSEYQRQQQMIQENATSEASVERWQSQRDQAQAQLDLAKLNFSYTHVTAPFAGRIGRHLVDVGNMVGVSGDTKLATIEKITPIYVYFNLDERDALRIRDAMRKLGMNPGDNVGKVPVWIGLQDENGYPHQGMLDFVDNGMSTSTGTIQLRAQYQNDDRTIFPGVFSRVRIPLGAPQSLAVVPGDAIGTDQQGDYVLVVGADDVVSRRSVEKGPATDAGASSIKSGITAQDRVVMSGFHNARPGEKVSVQSARPPVAPAA
jgi:membrane fusion protein, multidrug efflux system